MSHGYYSPLVITSLIVSVYYFYGWRPVWLSMQFGGILFLFWLWILRSIWVICFSLFRCLYDLFLYIWRAIISLEFHLMLNMLYYFFSWGVIYYLLCRIYSLPVRKLPFKVSLNRFLIIFFRSMNYTYTGSYLAFLYVTFL